MKEEEKERKQQNTRVSFVGYIKAQSHADGIAKKKCQKGRERKLEFKEGN